MKLFFFSTAVLVVCMRVGWGADTQRPNSALSTDDADVQSHKIALSTDNADVQSAKSALSTDDAEADDRQFLNNNNGFSLNFGTTGSNSVTIGNAGYIALGALLLIPLIIGLALLFYLFGGPRGGSNFETAASGGYGREIQASFNPYAIDWDKFSILDWIAVGEEAYNKFDPADLECQKRLICEVHQNTAKFGLAAKRIVDIFSYLQYAEVLHLPEEIKALIEEYLDAADRGRNPQKECGDVFTTCDFSVKRIFDKFSQNEV